MVTRFGMSDILGNVDLDSNHDRLSSETKRLIESEVRRTIEEGRQRATALLESKKKELELLAKALVDYETLNRDEAFKVIKGEKLEGKLIMPPGDLKLPEIGGRGSGGGPGGITGLPGVPPIPGSTTGDDNPRPPPVGGAVARIVGSVR